MSFSITGKTAIITGAANGIGLAIARHFAEQGANVMMADLDEAGLNEEVGEGGGEDGKNIRSFAGDLREKLTIANLLSATLDAFDRVDILINASRQITMTDALNVDETTLVALMQQNVMNGYRLSQAVARRFIQQAEKEERDEGIIGTIVNLSSLAATRTHPDLLAYSVSSAAQDQLTRSMAVAFAGHRIRVNSVAFGSVMSASLQDAIRQHGDIRSDIIDRTPLDRIAAPGELAEVMQFLASDASGFMTGQIVTVDGGRGLIDATGVPAY